MLINIILYVFLLKIVNSSNFSVKCNFEKNLIELIDNKTQRFNFNNFSSLMETIQKYEINSFFLIFECKVYYPLEIDKQIIIYKNISLINNNKSIIKLVFTKFGEFKQVNSSILAFNNINFDINSELNIIYITNDSILFMNSVIIKIIHMVQDLIIGRMCNIILIDLMIYENKIVKNYPLSFIEMINSSIQISKLKLLNNIISDFSLIVSKNSTIIINDSLFINNTYCFTLSQSSKKGYSLFISDSLFEFTNSTIYSNDFKFYNFIYLYNSDIDINIKKLIILNNIYITDLSGFFSFYNMDNRIIIEDCIYDYNIFVDNIMIYTDRCSRIIIYNISIKNNFYKNFIYLQNQIITIERIFCLNNNNYSLINKDYYSNCIVIDNVIILYIFDCLIGYNYAINSNPGIFIKESRYLSSLLVILTRILFYNNKIIKHNIDVDFFSITIIGNSYTSMINLYFKNNMGKSIYYDVMDGNLNIKACVFEGNIAEKYSINIHAFLNYLTIKNCLFINNSISTLSNEESYILLFGEVKELIITNTIINKNFAGNGLFYLLNKKNNINLVNLHIIDNAGIINTGLYFRESLENTNLIWKNSTYLYNTVLKYASFIFVYKTSRCHNLNISLINLIIENNFSPSNENSLLIIWLYSGNNYFNIENCIFKNNYLNSDDEGEFGVLFDIFGLENRINLKINRTVFINNTTYDFLLYFYFVKVYMIDIIFINNTQKSQNMIELIQCIVKLRDIIFYNNEFAHYLIKTENSMINIINLNIKSQKGFLFIYFHLTKLINLKNLFFLNQKSVELLIRMDHCEIIDINRILIMDCEFDGRAFIFSETIGNFINDILILFNDIEHYFLFKSNSDLQLFNFTFYSNYGNFQNTLFEIIKSAINLYDFYYNYSFSRNIVIYTVLSNFTMKSSFIKQSLISDNIMFYFIQANIYFHNDYFINLKNIMYSHNCMINLIYLLLNNTDQYLSKSIIFSNFYSIHLINCYFLSINSNESILKFFTKYKSYISILTCFFMNNNINNDGGCLIASNVILSCYNSSFVNNYAQRGGAMFLSCSLNDAKICNYKIISNKFMNNEAIIDGGAIKFLINDPILIDNFYFNNKASYNENISGTFCRLGFSILNNNTKIFESYTNNISDIFILTNITSKKIIPYTIKIFPLDNFNQIIKENLRLIIIAEASLKNYFTDLNIKTSSSLSDLYYVDKDFYCFEQEEDNNFRLLSYKLDYKSDYSYSLEDIFIIACPTSLIFFKFSFQGINLNLPENFYLKKNSLNENIKNGYSIVIPMKLKSCEIGEIYDKELKFCKMCEKGTYSIELKSDKCRECVKEADCLGGALIKLKPKYWKRNNSLDKIYLCNSIFNSCVGGYINFCHIDYDGILCLNCKDKNSYRNIFGLCESCHHINIFIYLLIIIILNVITLIFIYIISLFFIDVDNIFDRKLILKNFINYFHSLISIYHCSIKLNNSNLSYYWNIIIRTLTFNLNFSIDCIFDYDHNKIFYFNICSKIFLVYLSIFIYWIIKKKKNSNKIVFYSKFIILYYIIYLPLFAFFVKMITCKSINENYLLIENTNIVCSLNEEFATHLIIIVPNFIILSIGLPLFIILRFIYHIKNFNSKNKKRNNFANFLLKLIKGKGKFWEIKFFIENILMIIVSIILEDFFTKFILNSFIILYSSLIGLYYKLLLGKLNKFLYAMLHFLMMVNNYFLALLSENEEYEFLILIFMCSLNFLYVIILILLFNKESYFKKFKFLFILTWNNVEQ